MNAIFHPGMTSEKWAAKPYSQQVLNVASELSRARHWIKEGETENLRHSLDRALELIDLTVSASRGTNRLRGLLRFREELAGYYLGMNKEYDKFNLLLKSFLNLEPEIVKLGITLAD
jgi:hypothetical protein